MNLLGWFLMGLGLALGFVVIGAFFGTMARFISRKDASAEIASGGEPQNTTKYTRSNVINAAANLDLAIRGAILSGVPIQIATYIDHSMPHVYRGGRPIVHVAVLDGDGNPEAQWPVRIEP